VRFTCSTTARKEKGRCCRRPKAVFESVNIRRPRADRKRRHIQKKPRRLERGKVSHEARMNGVSQARDIPRLSQSSINDSRAANLWLVLSTAKVNGEARAAADAPTKNGASQRRLRWTPVWWALIASTSCRMSDRFGRPSERRRVRIGVAIAADASDRIHALLPATERARVSRAHVPAILGTPRPIGRRFCRVRLDQHCRCECQHGEDHSRDHGLLPLGTRIRLLGRVRSGATVDRKVSGRAILGDTASYAIVV
jgi:hypothetical protein